MSTNVCWVLYSLLVKDFLNYTFCLCLKLTQLLQFWTSIAITKVSHLKSWDTGSVSLWKLRLHDGRKLHASTATDKLEVKMCCCSCSHPLQSKRHTSALDVRLRSEKVETAMWLEKSSEVTPHISRCMPTNAVTRMMLWCSSPLLLFQFLHMHISIKKAQC